MARRPGHIEGATGRHEVAGHRGAPEERSDTGQVAPEGRAVQGREAILVRGS